MLIGLTILMFGLLGYWCEAIVYKGNQLKKENLETKKKQLEIKQEMLKQRLEDLEFSKEMSEMPKGKVMEISSVEEQIREISKSMNFNPETCSGTSKI